MSHTKSRIEKYLAWAVTYVPEWHQGSPRGFASALSLLVRGQVKRRKAAVKMLKRALQDATTDEARVLIAYWLGKTYWGISLEQAGKTFAEALALAPREDEGIWREALLGPLGFCSLKWESVDRKKESVTATLAALEAKGWTIPDEFEQLSQALENPSSLVCSVALFRLSSRAFRAYRTRNGQLDSLNPDDRLDSLDSVFAIYHQELQNRYREQVLGQLVDSGMTEASLPLIRDAFGDSSNGGEYVGQNLCLLACAAAVLEDARSAEHLFEDACESSRSCGGNSPDGLWHCLVARALLRFRSGDSSLALELMSQAHGWEIEPGGETLLLTDNANVNALNALLLIADVQEELGEFHLAHEALEKAGKLHVTLQPRDYLKVLQDSLACRESLLNGDAEPNVPSPARFSFTPFIYRTKLALLLHRLRGRHLDGLRIGRKTLLHRGVIPNLDLVAREGGCVGPGRKQALTAAANVASVGEVYGNAGMRQEALKCYLVALKVLDFPDCPVAPDDINQLYEDLRSTSRDRRLVQQGSALLRTSNSILVHTQSESATLEQLILRRQQARMLFLVGFNRFEDGTAVEAARWFAKVCAIGRETHSHSLITLGKCGLGVAHQFTAAEGAIPLEEIFDAARLARTTEDPGTRAFVDLQLKASLVRQHRVGDVLTSGHPESECPAHVGGGLTQAWSRAYDGAALRLSGEPEAALTCLEDADGQFSRLGSVRGHAFILAHRSLAFVSLGQKREAAAAFDNYERIGHRAGAFLLDHQTCHDLTTEFPRP